MVFPRCNLLEMGGAILPGVARFPVQDWVNSNKPVLDDAGWYALAARIAEKDMQNLDNVFILAEKELKVSRDKGKHYDFVAGPVQHATPELVRKYQDAYGKEVEV